MSLGSKTYYYVDTSYSRVLNETPRDLTSLITLRSIRLDEDLTQNLLAANLINFRTSLNRYAQEAARNYINGLPELPHGNLNLDLTTVTPEMNLLAGETTTVLQAKRGYVDSVWYVKWTLQQTYGYLEYPNTLTYGALTCTVDSISDTGSQYHVVITNTASPFESYDLYYAYAPYDIYWNIRYIKNSDPDNARYFVWPIYLRYYGLVDTYNFKYSYNNGLELDTAYGQSHMLPIVVLRKNLVNIDKSDKATYKSAKNLLSRINLDIDEFIASLSESGDISKITDAFVLFGLNVHTSSIAGKKALFAIFESLYKKSKISKAAYDNYIADVNYQNYLANNDGDPDEVIPVFNEITITEDVFNVDIRYNYITKTTYTGQIGALNDIEITYSGTGDTSWYKLRKQISGTEYIEYYVSGLRTVTDIFTRSKYGYAQAEVYVDDTNNLILPLSRSFLNKNIFSNYEKEIIANEALHIVIYTLDSQYVSWYERPYFGRLLQFIGLVVLIWTGVDVYNLAYSSSIAAGASASTATFNAWVALGRAVLSNFAISYAVAKLAERAAGESVFVRILAFAAAVYATYNFNVTANMSTAESLLLATRATTDYITLDQSYQLENLREELEAEYMTLREIQEEIKNVQDLLNTDRRSVWEIETFFKINTYEEPEDFYYRTIHVGNPGVLSLEEIGNYHKNLLKLPELDKNSFNILN